MKRFYTLTLFIIAALTVTAPAQKFKNNGKQTVTRSLTLPNKSDSVKFLAIGDTGTGTSKQYELANLMVQYRSLFNYDFAIMMGDNLYGGEEPGDFKKKFEDVYKPLTDAGVKFYATLGNHDD